VAQPPPQLPLPAPDYGKPPEPHPYVQDAGDAQKGPESYLAPAPEGVAASPVSRWAGFRRGVREHYRILLASVVVAAVIVLALFFVPVGHFRPYSGVLSVEMSPETGPHSFRNLSVVGAPNGAEVTLHWTTGDAGVLLGVGVTSLTSGGPMNETPCPPVWGTNGTCAWTSDGHSYSIGISNIEPCANCGDSSPFLNGTVYVNVGGQITYVAPVAGQ
jgi:hypothetical protein